MALRKYPGVFVLIGTPRLPQAADFGFVRMSGTGQPAVAGLNLHPRITLGDQLGAPATAFGAEAVVERVVHNCLGHWRFHTKSPPRDADEGPRAKRDKVLGRKRLSQVAGDGQRMKSIHRPTNLADTADTALV